MEIINSKTGDTIFHEIVNKGLEPTRQFCEQSDFNSHVLEVSNNLKQRPIHLAVSAKNPALVSYLLSKGADVDSFKKGDWTSLMVCSALKGPEIPQMVQLLLNNRAKAELRNSDGWTAMHIASRTGQLDTVQILAKHSPSLVTTPSRNGRLPLHIASLNSHLDLVKFLVETGSPDSCSRPDACGSTPVLEAAVCGSVSILRFFSRIDDLKSHKDSRGLNCLHKAAVLGHLEVLRFLVEEQKFPLEEETNDGFTALMFAVMESQVQAAKLLVCCNAAPESSSRNVFSLSRGMSRAQVLEIFGKEDT